MKLALGIGLAVLAVAIGVLRSATLNGYKTDTGSKVYCHSRAFGDDWDLGFRRHPPLEQ